MALLEPSLSFYCWGKRTRTLCKTRQKNNKPPLPSILLANIQSLCNKLDKRHTRIKHQRDFRGSCILAFTEKWLEPNMPECGVTPDGFTIYHQDRTAVSGKTRGGGVCLMVNSLWATEICFLKTQCSPPLLLLASRVRPLVSTALSSSQRFTFHLMPINLEPWTNCM